MPRIPREFLLHPGLPFHKTWRGHNKEWNLASTAEKLAYLTFLNETLPANSSRLFALTLMSNHAHESYDTTDIPAFSHFMRRHHMRYGMFFNRNHNRCGKVAHDRPLTASVQNEHQAMIKTFYIHANPLRAHMVNDAKDYPWSTHRLYAFGKREPWMTHVVFPDWYMNLAETWEVRQRRYRELFDAYLRSEGLIRKPISPYGIGDPGWCRSRRDTILKRMKDRYGPDG